MKPSENQADQCVLLFSADWFKPHWHLLGLHIRDGHAQQFQAGLRTTAKDMIGDEAEYWYIDSSEERVLATRQRWLDALASHSADTSRLELLDRWRYSSSERKALRVVLGSDYADEWQELVGAPLGETEWDRWLMSLTPDLPDMLQTSAWSMCFG